VKSSNAGIDPSNALPSLDPAAPVRDDLVRVEAKLTKLLDSNETIISEICHYLVDAAGKRLRPVFILLVYRACGGTDAKVEDAVDAAIALELIHSATLLHDDIIDGGEMRRGKPSAFARYGAPASLVAGDFLFCRAFELCGRFEERLVRTAAQACIQLTEGEVMEGRMRHQTNATLDEYMTIITRKTASLFAAGGRVAADLAGASQTMIETMENLGLAFGRAFQMIDDVLDIVGSQDKIGKKVGADLKAGVLSLPAVIGMQDSPELRSYFSNGKTADSHVFDHALELMRRPATIKRSRVLAARQVAIARELMAELPLSPYRESLALLIENQTARDN
jgi:geranylgeranyl pyrophosphate synthase